MSVAIGRTQATFCATLVDELMAGGLRHAVICPGSRSTPLAIAIGASALTTHVRLDERSAGFFALGLARATKQAVLVLVTSGTAAAELHAAVVEAQLDRVSLIIATADRPPELHGIGSPQTMHQEGLYGDHVVFSAMPGPCHAWPENLWRPFASRLILESLGSNGRPGPVHVNLPFIEPLVSEADALPASPRPGQAFYTAAPAAPGEMTLASSHRCVVIAGDGIGDAEVFLAQSAVMQWPVLADPRSGLRSGAEHVIASGDALLRSEVVKATLDPSVIILAGAPPASRIVNEWIVDCAGRGTEIVVLGHDGPSRHPTQVSATFVSGEPSAILENFAATASPGESSWLHRWQESQSIVLDAQATVFGDGTFCEPSVAVTLSQLGSDVTLVSSSSMPIRDLEWFGVNTGQSTRVVANRGANGIDGVVSTAMGVATALTTSVVAVVGDLAFFHDVSALVDGVDDDSGLTVVVLDNGGGGIFSFLAQRQLLDGDVFEEFFGTPRRPDVLSVARGFDAEAREVNSHPEFLEALSAAQGQTGVHVIVARMPSRDENVARHELLHGEAVKALATALG